MKVSIMHIGLKEQKFKKRIVLQNAHDVFIWRRNVKLIIIIIINLTNKRK